MSTGSFSITSVQPTVSTSPSVTAPVSSGESTGFSTLYQDTLSNSPSAQQETDATTANPTALNEDSAKAHTSTTAENTTASLHRASTARHDKTPSTSDAETTVTQTSRRRATQEDDVDDEAANDILASIALEQMMANEPQDTVQKTLTANTMATAKGVEATTMATTSAAQQATQASDARNDALQQALALQQLVDQKRTEQTSTAGNSQTLKAAAQSAAVQDTSAKEQRPAVAQSLDSTAPSDRTRTRTTPVTTTQTTSALNQTTLTAAQQADDQYDVDATSSRSQADFGLQNALSQVNNGGNNGTQATSAATLPAIDSEHWNQALASHISTMSRMDQGQTTLTLAPASLGALEVSLQMDRGQADIQFVTHSRQAHDALTSSVNALHHALADQGIQVQNVSVVEHNPDAGQQTSQQQHAFSGMASDQQSQQSSYQAHEQASTPETAANAGQDDAVDSISASDTSTSTVQGLRATA